MVRYLSLCVPRRFVPGHWSSLRYGRCIADLHRRSYTAHGASGARCAQRIYTALKICQRAYFAKRAREAAKGLIYVFPAGSSRGTGLRFATVGVLPISTGDRTPRMARPVPDALSASIRHSKYAKGHILQSVPVKQPKGLSMCSLPVRPGALTRMARQTCP